MFPTKIYSLLLFSFVDVSVRRPCSSYAEYIPQLILFPSSFIYNSSSLSRFGFRNNFLNNLVTLASRKDFWLKIKQLQAQATWEKVGSMLVQKLKVYAAATVANSSAEMGSMQGSIIELSTRN